MSILKRKRYILEGHLNTVIAWKNGHSNINDRTPEEFKDIVFLNRTGFPTKNSTYDAAFAEDVWKGGNKSSLNAWFEAYICYEILWDEQRL